MNRCIVSLALLLPLSLTTQSIGQDAKAKNARPPRVSALWNDLAQPLSAEPFVEAMTLKEALTLLDKQFRERHGRDLPFGVNQQAFKDENAEAPDILESQVKLQPYPKVRAASQILRDLLKQVQTGNATYFLKPGVIEITTRDAIWPSRLLNQAVELKFTRQPLSFVLDEIYEQTGVNVILDPRVGVNARATVSITFTNDMALGTGLVLIAEMAHLKLVEIDNALFITTPAHANRFIWERGGIWYWRAEPYRKEAAAAPLPIPAMAGQ